MQTRNIPAEDWVDELSRASNEHIGWPATIEVLDPERGPQHIAQDLPLQGISFDTKGSRPSSIEVSVGDGHLHFITHVIDMPLRIRQVEQADGGFDVQIEPANGPVTLLHVRGGVH